MKHSTWPSDCKRFITVNWLGLGTNGKEKFCSIEQMSLKLALIPPCQCSPQ